ncbi:hypothetical protein BDZ91DRAFT_762431 [Kalaharituber pfeilii]|nr:hypothetical protein BDZ91DRAFT_762431 [Kalaharituber pfeilii]
MRRLFNRKPADEVDKKAVKEDVAKEQGKVKKSLFGRPKKDEAQKPQQFLSPQQQRANDATCQTNSSTHSSASSAISIPPSASYLPTPSASSSSFSSVLSAAELSTSTSQSESTIPSTAPSSAISRSPESSTSISSLNFASCPPTSAPVRPPLAVLTRPQSSGTGNSEHRKPLSPLSVVVDLNTVPTPPPSPGRAVEEEDEENRDGSPKRRPSIYNLFKKSNSQTNLNSAPSSGSNSTTTLPSTCTAPQIPPTELVPPVTPSNHHRRSVNFLRRKSSNHSLDELPNGEGILSRDEAIAHRAILQGDPLGGGPYLYPIGLGRKPEPQLPPQPQPYGMRNRRGGSVKMFDPRRSTWGGATMNGPGGMAWRAPHIGGRYGGKMTIEEENEMIEQQQQQQQQQNMEQGGAKFIEDAPYFPPSQQHSPMRRRPVSSQGGRPGHSGYGYFNSNESHHRPSYYPPFAPPMLPAITQLVDQPSAQA